MEAEIKHTQCVKKFTIRKLRVINGMVLRPKAVFSAHTFVWPKFTFATMIFHAIGIRNDPRTSFVFESALHFGCRLHHCQ